MINLLKYELKGRKIPSLWVVAGVFIVNLLIAIRFMFLVPGLEIFAKEMAKNRFNTDINNYISAIDPFLLFLAFMSIWILFLIPLINGISSFRTDYFKNPKYLVASIPQTATKIVGAKLIITLFELILVSLTFIFWFTSYAFILMRGEIRQYLDMFVEFAGKNIFIGILGYGAFLFQIILTTLIIYFIAVMFKFIKTKKAISIIIAVIAFNFIGFIQNFFENFFRQMSFLDIKIKTYGVENFIVECSNPDPFLINVGVVVFCISFAAALFYATTYLIDNKMEV